MLILSVANGIPLSMAGFKWTGTLRPKYPLSAKREVPAHIPRPDYADDREFRLCSVLYELYVSDASHSSWGIIAGDEGFEQGEDA